MGGATAGQLFEGDRRFDIVVRLPDAQRQDPKASAASPIASPATSRADGASLSRMPGVVPLSAVATIAVELGPNQGSRENGKRRVVITSNVRGRDLGSFVEELRGKVAAEVTLPAGSWVEYGGTFEQSISAGQRSSVVVPVVSVMIFGLSFMAFGSAKDAAIVFSGVPSALT
ncbi:hypothetical protein OY671_010207, partial [Metschnikowia pulcherrima]